MDCRIFLRGWFRSRRFGAYAEDPALETLTERHNRGLIPSSALVVASVLLIGIAVSAIFRAFGSRIPVGVPPKVRLQHAPFYSGDFGRFGPQEHPTLDFTLANRSGHAIKIGEVIPSCSCITATCSPHTIMSHASATVAVTYRGFPGVFGPFGKSVAVIYQAEPTGRRKLLHLYVRGDAVSDVPVQVYPQTVYFGNVVPGTGATSNLYFHGWLGLLRSLPEAVYISPGQPCRLVLRKIGRSRATRDKIVRLILDVPVTQLPGRFSCPVSLIGPAVGRVRVMVEGYILIRRATASAGHSSREPTKAADLIRAKPAN